MKALYLSIVIALLGGSGYAYHNYDKLKKEYSATTEAKLLAEKNLVDMIDENAYLMQKLSAEESKNSDFQNQITGLTSTIGVLDKLSKTDKELLQKYSKIYFLNENYVPESLTDIQADFINEKSKIIKIHSKVLPFLQKMVLDAKSSNLSLRIISGYRSFGDQSSLKSNYKLTYGSGANTFSADQGYSEHQLGTALDFTTTKLGADFSSFKSTPEYQWLLDNAYKYGFVLSYPAGNAYYQFEPWHWRFVGEKLATRLHNESEHFYDLDQRGIDNYLINIFED